MLDLSQPHTVVVVTSTCRLPFARGRLGPGVHHFEGDQRKYIRTVYHKKQLRTAAIHFIAGDTEQALRTIADLKHGKVAIDAHAAMEAHLASMKLPEFEGDTSALGDDISPDFIMGNGARVPSNRAALQVMAASGELARRLGAPEALSAESSATPLDFGLPIADRPYYDCEAALQELSDLGQEIGADEPMASGDDETLVIEDSQDKP